MMNSSFLTQSGVSREKFDFFEIEKMNSDHVFIVNIYSDFRGYINFEVNKSTKKLSLTYNNIFLSPDSHYFNSLPRSVDFTLPGFVDAREYVADRNGNRISMVFSKKAVNALFQYFF